MTSIGQSGMTVASGVEYSGAPCTVARPPSESTTILPLATAARASYLFSMFAWRLESLSPTASSADKPTAVYKAAQNHGESLMGDFGLRISDCGFSVMFGDVMSLMMRRRRQGSPCL